MRKLTEEEKQKLKGKLQEASAHRTDRVLEIARHQDEGHDELVRGLAGEAIGWGVGFTVIFPPLGIIIGIYLLIKGRKLAGPCVLVGSIVVFFLYALGILGR